MDADFFRFPHTPHLVWLGQHPPRDDKILSVSESQSLLAGKVVIEEKLDGANLGFSLAPNGSLRAQNRGQYLAEPHAGQFSRLPAWLNRHGNALHGVLTPDLIVFGEWCAARHSLPYAKLPDWFSMFDVYDRRARRFWSSTRRNALATAAGLVTVPHIAHGDYTIAALRQLADSQSSRYRDGPMEGMIIRREFGQWCDARAKLVRSDFTQAIGKHWRRRSIEWNRVDSSVYTP